MAVNAKQLNLRILNNKKSKELLFNSNVSLRNKGGQK